MLWKEWVLAVAVSIDSLGIGVSYEMKKIQIPWLAKWIIAAVTAVIMYASLWLGGWMKGYFPADVLNLLGNSIMILVGLAFVRKSLVPGEQLSVDRNHSERIENGEACLLAVILSLDTVGIGAAYAAMELGGIRLALLSGVMQIIFLTIGTNVARKSLLLLKANERFCGVCSGVILILLAIVRIMF